MLLAISSSLHAVAITPAEPTGAVASLPRWRRPSLNLSQVGFRIALFEACSAFTSRYGLHLRQVAYQRPSTPKASTALLPPPLLRLLPAGATLTGRVSHPLKIAAFPRRTEKCRLGSQTGCYHDAGVCQIIEIVLLEKGHDAWAIRAWLQPNIHQTKVQTLLKYV